MSRTQKIVGSAALLAAAFFGGYWSRGGSISTDSGSAGPRKPLYYHDPMHPAYKSDKPGIAPDCGMQLEPVYADSETAAETGSQLPEGAVRIDTRKQQLMGLRTAQVLKASGARSIHLVGKVVPDDTRVDRVTALADGVVRVVSPYAAGSLVQKDDLLATYFVATRDIYTAIQSLILASGNFDQAAAAAGDSGLIKTSKAQARVEEELLKSYGLTASQIRDLSRTREATRDIEFRAPVSGIVLDRNVARGQTVAKGAELFRIADLTHVWVLADVFEDEESLFKAGAVAQVTYGERTYSASVSGSRQFDPVSRTLKVRLDMDNPGMKLRPEMFVNIDFSVQEPKGLNVPADSVLDTGLAKTVFVNTSGDVFEPRTVTVGGEYGGQMQILSGLREGENVVVSGTFLLDSESRLQASANGEVRAIELKSVGAKSSDPVCGMPLESTKTEHTSQTTLYHGRQYRFCSKDCKAKFDRNPVKYADEKSMRDPGAHRL